MQRGTIDAVPNDDDSIAAPVDVSVFGGNFSFATRYGLDVPVLFNQFGLKEIWGEAYGEAEALKFWDEIATNSPRSSRSVEICKQYNATMSKAGKP